MQLGKLAEPVQKRSVFRQLNMEIAGTSGHYGADCAVLENGAGNSSLLCAAAVSVPGIRSPHALVNEAVNRVLASGGVLQSLMIRALLPESCEECKLQETMKRFAAEASRYGLTVADAQAEVTAGVTEPQYVVTVTGTVFGSDCRQQQLLNPGQELVLTKWIALGGTAALAQTYEEELLGRYPFSLIDCAKNFSGFISVEDEARAITHFGACAVHNVSQGGIFNALWEMAERAGVGLEVDLKRIPVRQETIEICEYFDINPYYLYSAGSLLIGTEHAEALIAALAKEGVAAAVIGRVSAGKERLIRNGEECRFLDRPKQDEWYRRVEK